MAKPLRIIPLGGLGEVGKNMLALEYGDDIVVIDAGVMFPKEDMLGVDLVLPDITYLLEHREQVRAILITHGHEDHTGALPYVLRELNVPVYAPPLAHDLVEVKLGEHRDLPPYEIIEVHPGDSIQFGEIEAEYFQVCHSIPDACGIALHTPAGVVIHTGDFKIDHTPVDGKQVDLQRIAELGSEGVLLLLSDSTYAELSGFTPSEQVVGIALEQAIGHASGRVLVTTFASLISRVQQVIDAAVAHGRKVAFAGRSMVNNVGMAVNKGYLKAPPGTLVELKQLTGLPNDQQVIVTTGAQGEPTSALVRIANRDHSDIRIQEGDLVIISATAIPGNETMVSRTIDNLYRQGAQVLHSRTAMVHVHGHGSQEELKLMLSLVKPRYFVPVHGEYRMLAAHAALAKAVGVAPPNVFVLEDGDVLEIADEGAAVVGHVSAGHIYVDGLGQLEMRSVVLRDRRVLAREGTVIVVVPVDHASGNLVGAPEVVSSGFVEAGEVGDLLARASELVATALSDNTGVPLEWSFINSKVREALGGFLYKETRRRPMIIPVPIEV